MRTISNIFALDYFLAQAVWAKKQEETLGRSNWSVNIYCTRAASCEDKPGYVQKAEGGEGG